MLMMSAASLRALLDFCSPSAATTYEYYVMKIKMKISLNLGSSFPGSFSLSSHGSLELLRKADILYLDSLHVDTPGISGNLQTMMHGISNVLSIRQDLRQILGTQDVSKS